MSILSAISFFSRNPNPYQSYISYLLVDKLLWLGLHGVINEFRTQCLGLLPIRESEDADSLIHTLKVPFTYCWSPHLIPKPLDWGPHIDVCGFFFLKSLSHNYEPPENLASFLKSGMPPIYVGFGSIVVDEIDHIYTEIFGAIEATKTRAIVCKGWSGDKSKGSLGLSPYLLSNVFFVGNCPHDWLFPRCSAVCHHGGAGTIAAGLKAGKPTIVVPFFGDQFFWGGVIERSGAGPQAIEAKNITTERFIRAIRFCQSSTVQGKAVQLRICMSREDGLKTGKEKNFSDSRKVIITDLERSLFLSTIVPFPAIAFFNRQLPLDQMQCEVCLHTLQLALVNEVRKSLDSLCLSIFTFPPPPPPGGCSSELS